MWSSAGYANFRPNVFAAGKRISMEILVGMGLHVRCHVALKRFGAFSKKRKCARKIFCNIKRLEQDIKSRCNPHLKNAWKLKYSTVRVICTYDQCDSAFYALQLTALVKPKWCVLLYCCACLHPNTILVEADWTTVPRPATNLSILICKLSARTKQSVISVALKTPPEIRLGICIYKTSLLHRPDDYTGFTPSCPPHIYNKIAPMSDQKSAKIIFKSAKST